MNMQEISPPADGEALPDDLLTVTECAKAIGKNKSTISRQLAANMFKNWGSDAKPMLSLAQVKAARAGQLDLGQQRGPTAKGGRAQSEFQSERTQNERFKRLNTELDFKERLGQVLEKTEVEDDFETLGRMIRERLTQAAPNLLLEMEKLPTAQAKQALMVQGLEAVLVEVAAEVEILANGGAAPSN